MFIYFRLNYFYLNILWFPENSFIQKQFRKLFWLYMTFIIIFKKYGSTPVHRISLRTRSSWPSFGVSVGRLAVRVSDVSVCWTAHHEPWREVDRCRDKRNVDLAPANLSSVPVSFSVRHSLELCINATKPLLAQPATLYTMYPHINTITAGNNNLNCIVLYVQLNTRVDTQVQLFKFEIYTSWRVVLKHYFVVARLSFIVSFLFYPRKHCLHISAKQNITSIIWARGIMVIVFYIWSRIDLTSAPCIHNGHFPNKCIKFSFNNYLQNNSWMFSLTGWASA